MSAVPQSWSPGGWLGKPGSRSERTGGPHDAAYAKRQREERHGEQQREHECRSVRARGQHDEPVEESSNE